MNTLNLILSNESSEEDIEMNRFLCIFDENLLGSNCMKCEEPWGDHGKKHDGSTVSQPK